METTVNYLNEHEIALDLSVDWEAVKEDYEALVKRYAHIPVKGFRKPPPKLIESMYRKQLKNDLASMCSERLCRKALQENELVAGSPISVTDIFLESGKKFGFKAQFLKMPDFELPDYKNLHLESEDHDDKLDEISEKLLYATTINLPDAFIDNELEYFEDENEIVSEESRQAAADRVKLLLILKKIASNDAIEVDDRDIEERIKQVAEENEASVQEVKELLLSSGGISRLSDFILAENVLNYIIDLQGEKS